MCRLDAAIGVSRKQRNAGSAGGTNRWFLCEILRKGTGIVRMPPWKRRRQTRTKSHAVAGHAACPRDQAGFGAFTLRKEGNTWHRREPHWQRATRSTCCGR
jgi:hypothetical protein